MTEAHKTKYTGTRDTPASRLLLRLRHVVLLRMCGVLLERRRVCSRLVLVRVRGRVGNGALVCWRLPRLLRNVLGLLMAQQQRVPRRGARVGLTVALWSVRNRVGGRLRGRCISQLATLPTREER